MNRYSKLPLEDFIQVLRACAANTQNDQLRDMVSEAARRLRIAQQFILTASDIADGIPKG